MRRTGARRKSGAKLLRRTGPAAGHRSDPDFRREDVDELEDEEEEDSTGVIASAPTEEDKDAAQAVKAMAVRKVRPQKVAVDEPVDVDVIDEDATALPAGEAALSDELEDLEEAPSAPVAETDSGTYEYVDDTSGLAIAAEPSRERHQAPPVYSSSRRRRFDPDVMAKENARKFAEKARRMVEDHVFTFESKKIPVTISLGVADLTGDTTEPGQFIKLADANLYKAKKAGRNRVVG